MVAGVFRGGVVEVSRDGGASYQIPQCTNCGVGLDTTWQPQSPEFFFAGDTATTAFLVCNDGAMSRRAGRGDATLLLRSPLPLAGADESDSGEGMAADCHSIGFVLIRAADCSAKSARHHVRTGRPLSRQFGGVRPSGLTIAPTARRDVQLRDSTSQPVHGRGHPRRRRRWHHIHAE